MLQTGAAITKEGRSTGEVWERAAWNSPLDFRVFGVKAWGEIVGYSQLTERPAAETRSKWGKLWAGWGSLDP